MHHHENTCHTCAPGGLDTALDRALLNLETGLSPFAGQGVGRAPRLVTAEDQRRLDRAFQKQTGLPGLVLMDAAAAALVRAATRVLDTMEGEAPGTPDLVIVTGFGQNGGDGWAAGRMLRAAGYDVLVWDVTDGDARKGDAAQNARAYRALGGRVASADTDISAWRPRLVIDAVFGTGFDVSRPLNDAARRALCAVTTWRDAGAFVIACDLPSGLDADTGVAVPETPSADLTVTFGRAKIGLVTHPGCLLHDRVEVEPLSMTEGFVDEVLTEAPVRATTLRLAADLLPDRVADDHKGRHGRALLIGGAEGMPGALVLSAHACMRAGAGYTMLRAPQATLPLLAAAVPSALLSAVPEGTETKRDLPGPLDAVAVGMGAGDAPWLGKAMSRLIRGEKRLIIDADGLNLLAARDDLRAALRERESLGLEPAVLTPHPGEWRRLMPDRVELIDTDRVAAARALASDTRCLVVLKGMSTVIARPDGAVWINQSGNDSLGKGGSGDILSGLIVGLAAQLKDSARAACLAVTLHGMAADLAVLQVGDSAAVTPDDVLRRIGEATARVRDAREPVV